MTPCTPCGRPDDALQKAPLVNTGKSSQPLQPAACADPPGSLGRPAAAFEAWSLLVQTHEAWAQDDDAFRNALH